MKRSPQRRSLLTGAALATCAALFLGACSKSDNGAAGNSKKAAATSTSFDEATAKKVTAHYAEGVFASYSASVASARELQKALTAFTAQPSEESLATAKQAWIAGRADYLPTEAFRFYDGPIDNPDDGPEGRINAWPMDEAYVDYVQGANGIDWVGIINDTANYPTIDKDVLVEANERDGEENISTGWHAIEFLLWGQDMNDDGPGNRPVSDYTTAPNADRRAQYLNLLGEILVSDLDSVAQQWAPDAKNYRAVFVADTRTAVSHMFRGVGALTVGELSGERMAVAIETRDQEDEHSCFSDTTNDDVVGDIKGIKAVLDGYYPALGSGPGLVALIKAADAGLASRLLQQVDATLQIAETLPAPFDRLLANDTAPLEQIVDGLTEQGKLIADGAKRLGIEVDTGV